MSISPWLRASAFLLIGLFCFPRAGAETIPGFPSANCRTNSDVLKGLSAWSEAMPKIVVRTKSGLVRPSHALSIVGLCADDLVGARANQLRLKSGVTVELVNGYNKTSNTDLKIHTGPTVFDNLETVGILEGHGRDQYGDLLVLSKAFSSGPRGDRYVGVWAAPHGSLIGFVDIDPKSGTRSVFPLFQMPYHGEIAHYFPGPDGWGGTISVLARKGSTAKVVWVDVIQ